MEIRSKIDGRLLHIIFRRKEMLAAKGRADIVPDNQFLQCSALHLSPGQTFRPHQHIWKDGEQKVIAQESWVIIEGVVRVFYYDTDKTLLQDEILMAGDISVTLEGGHNYRVEGVRALVYEFKTGPYKGQALDKEFI